jgi:hypothetical protein
VGVSAGRSGCLCVGLSLALPNRFRLATDHYWTFYALLTDEICLISYELHPLDLTVEGAVV